ncbi:MAG TPA: DUF4384 domain-containing protein [Gemmatimonadales bacterium]|nr:DUF4384 domain-containing protein [Gemmatimonadales bacterium]
MVVPLLALLLQTPPRTPVHVWLDSASPVARGSAVRVYVQVVADGNLIVLRRRTDGRISVLFPSSPAAAPLVRAGTYEIRGPGDRPAFVVTESDGQGMILAALAADPMRFNEFVREADWSSDALVPSWGGADAEGALTDIVQRMLGNGTFNYDFVTYTVAPAVYTYPEPIPGNTPYTTCAGCTIIGTEVVVAAPFLGCDDFFGVCFGFPHFQRGRERRRPVEDRPARVLALDVRPRTGPAAVARSRQVSIPHRDRSTPVIKPRRRLPDAASTSPTPQARGIPVLGERPPARHAGGTIVTRRRVAPSMPLAAGGSGTTAPLRHVRFTRLSNPSTGDHVARGGVVAVSRGAVVPAGGASLPAAARSGTRTRVGGLATPRANVPATASDAGAVRAPRAPVTAGARARTEGTHGLALPRARWRATGGRAGVARAGVARH